MAEYTYPSFDGEEFEFLYYRAEDSVKNPQKKCPTLIFFFGGGWMGGRIHQFDYQAKTFVKNGFNIISPYYRTNRDGKNFLTSMRDAFYFLKYIGEHTEEFSIDKDRVFLSGGSAGAHLALCSTLFNNVPNQLNLCGLVLFNPVVDTSELGYQSKASLEQPWNPILFSPLHFLRGAEQPIKIPPTAILHGKKDECVLYERVLMFCDLLKKNNTKVELFSYPEATHGFFNYFEDRENPYCDDTLQKALNFCLETIREK